MIPLRRRRWLPYAVTVVVTVAATASVATVLTKDRPAGDTAPPTAEAATSTITRQTLVDTTAVPGELGYGPAEPIEAKASGTVTWLPEIGAVVARGEVLLRVDDKPVVLLYGDLPAYRELGPGITGSDVRQFETNLRELGYTGFTVDDEYSEATAAAVKRWQHRLRVDETGIVAVSAVVYAREAVRIAGRSVRVGASSAAEVLTFTADRRVVTAAVPLGAAGWAVVGTRVTVVLPDRQAVAGTVSAVAREATAAGSQDADGSPGQGGQGSVAATVPVTVAVEEQGALGEFERTPVEVRYVAQERRDVLAAPVVALLAPAEGGYAIEVVDETGGGRIVPVETGLFADGWVEIRGAGLEAGMTIRVPA